MCWQFLQTRSNVCWQLHSTDLRLASESLEQAIRTCLKLKKKKKAKREKKKTYFFKKPMLTVMRRIHLVSEKQPLSFLDQAMENLRLSSVVFRLWFSICYFPLESEMFFEDVFLHKDLFFFPASTPPPHSTRWHLSFIKASLVPPLFPCLFLPVLTSALLFVT